jgi:predicted O-linked N-acetylglucosamine transferase (SPINDLY family)
MPPEPAPPAAELDAVRSRIARGEIEQAEQSAWALARAHADSACWLLAGETALLRSDFQAATFRLARALGLDQSNGAAWIAFGRMYLALGRHGEAIAAAERALALDESSAEAWVIAARAFDAEHRHDEARNALHFALEARPGFAPALMQRASLELAAGDLAGAEASLTEVGADSSVAGGADFAFIEGLVHAARARHAEAVASLERSLALFPANAPAAAALAQSREELGRWHDAARACERALALDPTLDAVRAQLLFLKRRLCEWRGLEALSTEVRAVVARAAPGITPFSFLSEPASPAEQLACARLWAESKWAATAGERAKLPPLTPRPGGAELRIGFVSSGFNNHPTALLIVELIERLRDEALRTLAFATTPDDGGALRRRLRAAFDEFHELDGQPYPVMADRIWARHCDVLIDLRGYGGGAVTEVFALRPAPLQVNWLAYPGTSGATFIDYLIADRNVVPDAQRPYYSERLVRLPHCFQPSDSTRRIAQPPARESLGLPSAGPLLVSFNNSYKIGPDVFAAWMEILAAVPDAKLWLLAARDERHAIDNLRASAAAAGIDPVRLSFQMKLPHDEYLALYRHAALFLDTWPYNAHTTASDALWAGCPVLTLAGDTFASRVAASLLTTLELPELIAPDRAGYVARAIALASDAKARLGLAERLARARSDKPLFDMRRFARDFARALRTMVDRGRRGEPPADLDL